MTERRWIGRQWVVEVTYKGSHDRAKDKEVARVVGRPIDGSGYAFFEKERDLCFHYKMERYARAAADRAGKINGVKVRVVER